MSPASLAAEVTGLVEGLRAAGMTVDPARAAGGIRAVAVTAPATVDDLYWATRLTLCSRRQDLPVFDTVFARWVGIGVTAAGSDPAAAPSRPVPSGGARVGDAAERTPVPRPRSAGAEEVLTGGVGPTLDAAARAEIAALVTLLRRAVGARRAARRVPGRRYEIDLHRTIRFQARAGGELVGLRYRRRPRRPRPVVLLIDVSASMRESVDRSLRLAYAMVTVAPATTEVFTAGTRLTRITPALRDPDPAEALWTATAAVADRDGGTRFGATVREFLRGWAGRAALRAAAAVIVSDGLDSDRAMLRQQVRRLSLVARRVAWLHPFGRPGAPSFAPGLRDCRPYLDRVVLGHDDEAMVALADWIGGR